MIRIYIYLIVVFILVFSTSVEAILGSNTNQNQDNPLDVNDDGLISPTDALRVINDLNSNGARTLAPRTVLAPPYLDVNGDSIVSATDALTLINYLNSRSVNSSAEGESIATISWSGDKLAQIVSTTAGRDNIYVSSRDGFLNVRVNQTNYEIDPLVFDNVYVKDSGGYDIVRIYGSEAEEHVDSSDRISSYHQKDINVKVSFEGIEILAAYGNSNNDSAKLSQSSRNDYFVSYSNYSYGRTQNNYCILFNYADVQYSARR